MTGTVPEGARVFDRARVRRQRTRAAATLGGADFLLREVGERLADRLDDIRRRFPLALDLGCHRGELGRVLAGRGVDRLIQADLAPEMAKRAGGPAVACDEELLPFAEASLDAVLSCFSLHWVNDLPGALVQIRRALKPDGLFLAAMLGGDTLTELRQAWLEAESEVEGGVSPRVSPFVDLRDAAGLLQRAGFALPVADADRLTVTYTDALTLMRELKAMGEANALIERRRSPTRRDTLAAAAAIYQSRFAEAGDRVRATFQVIYLIGWAPSADQPKALRPGSAASRLAAALGTAEKSAGEKARR
ncbi:MAG: methyltransferase domain-containing protein [Alphaproteobacteria bacterium]|nr:methyltransferase domain-containing protein [Alphaproteobacteria bacterium]